MDNTILRQPIEAIEALQSEKLRHVLALCAKGHPFYRKRWAEAGIDIASIRTVADLPRLPLTTKQDLMADPEAFRLDVPELPLHERALWEIIHTTGSTADPTPIYNTTHDFHAYLLQAGRVSAIVGIRDDDMIANLLPLTPAPMGAFLRGTANAYAAGCAVFGALTGSPHGDFGVHRSLDDAVRMVARHRATILWGVPSFIRRVLIRAVELGADFSTVRMCAVTGEASTPAMREDLRAHMRAAGARGWYVFDRYGSTELGGLAQCQEEGEWHNPAPETQYHEAVDPQTGARLPDGERGALAVTHIDRRGTVLVRFLVGDVASVVRTPCPHCGRSGDRIVGPVTRVKDLIKVKGMLINPPVLLELLRGIAGIDEFQVVVQKVDAKDPFSMDEMVVRVASSVAISDAERESLAAKVVEAGHTAVRVRPRVEFAQASEIYDPRQTKAVRFVDRRAQ